MPTLRHRRHRSLPASFWPGESTLLVRSAVMATAHLRRDPVTVAWPGYVPGGQRAVIVSLEMILHDAAPESRARQWRLRRPARLSPRTSPVRQKHASR